MAATPVKLLFFDQSAGLPTETNSTSTAALAKLALSGISGVAIDAGGNSITNVANPVNPTDVVNLQYLAGVQQGLSGMASVICMAAANISSLSGLQTIDGISLVAGNRVLLTGQTNAVQNGVWIINSSAWTRPTQQPDTVTGGNAAGRYCFIEEGTYANQGWFCISLPGTDVVDTSPLQFSQFSGVGDITPGNGLVKGTASTNSIAISLASGSGLQFTNAALDTLLLGTGGLQKSATGLAAKLNGATLSSTSAGLSVLGLPSLFTINGASVDANVTSAALDVLCDGSSSLADSYHQHTNVLSAQTVVQTHTTSQALNLGDPVIWGTSANMLAKADATSLSTSNVIGIALTAASANQTVQILKRGLSPAIVSGGSPGQAVYLAVGGGCSASLATGTSQVVCRIGICTSSTGTVDVAPMVVGQRAAS